MMRIYLIFCCTLILSCVREDLSQSLRAFSDDFESYKQVSDMVGTAAHQWTESNLVENHSPNPIQLDTQIVHSGAQSVRFECLQNAPGFQATCKCNLNKGNLYFRNGETLYYSVWYYIERDEPDYGDFTLFDIGQLVYGTLEVRILVWEENLALEREKMGLSNIDQETPVTIFPVNQWVYFEMELKLSQNRQGSVNIWLDGQEIIQKKNIRTMPKDLLNVLYQTKNYYERIQVGITASSFTEKLVMYVDDLEIKLK